MARMRAGKGAALKNTVTGVKMKRPTVPNVKKKPLRSPMSKALEDSISDTISFVIKGKFSPIKAATDAKKAAITLKKKKNDSPVKITTDNELTKLTKEKKFAIKKEIVDASADNTAKKSVTASANKTVKTDTTANVLKNIKSVPINNNNKKIQIVKAKRVKRASKAQITKTKVPEKKVTTTKKSQTITKLMKQSNKLVKSSVVKNEVVKEKNIAKDKPKKASTQLERKKALRKKITAATTPAKLKRKNQLIKTELLAKQLKSETQIKNKIKTEESNSSTDDTSTTSDEISLDLLRQNQGDNKIKAVDADVKAANKINVKIEQDAEIDKKPTIRKTKKVWAKKPIKVPVQKPKLILMKKRLLSAKDIKRKVDQRARKLKLFSYWNGPKRHRVASLNAAAKVHCLYENESRATFIDMEPPPLPMIKKEPIERKTQIKTEIEEIPSTRTLRTVPGLRNIGKMWDMHTSSSSSEDLSDAEVAPIRKTPIKTKTKAIATPKKVLEKKPQACIKRRKRPEIVMDLKDMVVRKRMASLNATAILAASYSVEKRGIKNPKTSDGYDDDSSSETDEENDSSSDNYTNEPVTKKKHQPAIEEDDIKKEEVTIALPDESRNNNKVIEVATAPNKVAVILNQDTDVTITGVYVNSTTRSTHHHEGYCSIAGMQYRISATSHTQTAATAVATETILQSASTSSQENSNGESTPTKSYTPLDALSNMQPPAGTQGAAHVVPIQHHHLPPPHIGATHVLPHNQLSPLGRRHGCPSAFSAPPGPCVPPGHHLPIPAEHGYIHGYYQPAGPLISVPHGISQPQLAKSVPLSEPSPSVTPPTIHQPPPPSSAGDSSDSEVIITSVTSAKELNPPLLQQSQQQQQPPPQQYRFNHYPPAHPGYSYNYPPAQYYTGPPQSPAYSHHDLCYQPNPYTQPKYHMFRRYVPPPGPPQYYQTNSPDLYNQSSPPNPANQQVVTATSSASGNNYQPPPNGPPPPTLIETYPSAPPQLVESYPPPPAHYYSGYAPGPPSCYSHQPGSRNIPYINATYQSCPCPLQSSCPKNVHTGPLAGDSKRSSSHLAKEPVQLPPVALALPLEPASATGPPSPARGSAGMPPPSPAGATYQSQQPPTTNGNNATPPKQERVEQLDIKPGEKRRKARLGKAMVRNTIASANQNTMLLMCHTPANAFMENNVKREVESPKDESKKIIESKIEIVITDESKTNDSQLITTQTTELMSKQVKIEELEKEAELPPCQKTVAENVKVKNMKRKLSITKEIDKVEVISDDKKVKLGEKSPNGSYKDLIKKTNTNVVKINNGKRKLIGVVAGSKFAKIKIKKQTRKRKLSPTKEDATQKRLKASKPLTASNLHNSKQNLKETKTFNSSETLIENTEPTKKPNLFATKNNVDRTIESVINATSSADDKATEVVVEPTTTMCVSRTDKCKKATPTIKTIKTNNKTPTTTPQTVKCAKRKNIKNINNNNITPNNKSCAETVIPEQVPQLIPKIPRRSLQQQIPRWSNGWCWEGEGYEGKVFLNSDETTVIRKCYPAMRHQDGDIIEPRDCVLLRAGQRKNELPFVAKIAALWENPDDGEMMMSLLWYYRPEHTEQGRLQSDQPDEVFASRHKDSNSVACIDDKCYVLTFNEYCRYRKNLRRLEEGLEDTTPCIPILDPYPRTKRQPPTKVLTAPDLVFFCRRVYDFRQKRIVKNPS